MIFTVAWARRVGDGATREEGNGLDPFVLWHGAMFSHHFGAEGPVDGGLDRAGSGCGYA